MWMIHFWIITNYQSATSQINTAAVRYSDGHSDSWKSFDSFEPSIWVNQILKLFWFIGNIRSQMFRYTQMESIMGKPALLLVRGWKEDEEEEEKPLESISSLKRISKNELLYMYESNFLILLICWKCSKAKLF